MPLATLVHRCTVLHCTGSSGPAWSATPVLMTVHDLIPMLVDEGQGSTGSERFRRRLARGLARARSSPYPTTLVRTRRGLSRRRRQGQRNPLGFARASATQPRIEFASPHPYILAFGGAAPRKNTLFTLERFAKVAPALTGVQLILVGISAAAQREQVKSAATRLGVAARVEMPGFVDEATLGRPAVRRNDAALLVHLRRLRPSATRGRRQRRARHCIGCEFDPGSPSFGGLPLT